MPEQKILYEAGPMLDSKRTGVGYFVSHLVSSMQNDYGDRLQLTGYYFNFLNRRKNSVPAGLRFHKVWLIPGKLISFCRRLGFQPWLETFVRSKSDIVFFTNYVALPLIKRRKIILAVYDLGFLDAPQYTQEVNLRYLQKFCVPSIKKADVIITISEFTRERLRFHFPNLKAKIVVTPIPPLNNAKRQALTPRLLNQGINKSEYILYVGTIEPRKNLEALVKAYSRMPENLRHKYSLVLAGGKGWKDESIRSAIAKKQEEGLNIILPGYVTDEEKDALYSNAVCFVLPSHYEGFGMPILEAMQHGTPVVISDIPVFHEVASDAALYFDKDSLDDIASKLASVLNDSGLRETLSRKGEIRLKNFSWGKNAKKVFEAIT